MLVVALSLLATADRPATPTSATDPGARFDAVAKLPLAFEPNVGQAETGYDFVAHGSGFDALLSATGTRVDTGGSAGPSMRLVGTQHADRLTGLDPLPTTTNYIVGNDRSDWRTGVPTFGRLLRHGAYPGIDVVYHGSRAALEYDFVVAPDADPSAIAIDFGTHPVLGDDGDLVVGAVRHHEPVAFQDTASGRRPVKTSYVVGASGVVHLTVGRYDRRLPLTIDPIVTASTYEGGPGLETPASFVADRSGNTYVLANAYSQRFPTTPNALQPSSASMPPRPVVIKLSADLSQVVYATYLYPGRQSNQDTVGTGIAVDGGGNVYVVGNTLATGSQESAFPVQNPFQRCDTDGDLAGMAAFLFVLNSGGDSLRYSTCFAKLYLWSSYAKGVAVDAGGRAWVVGWTNHETVSVTRNAVGPRYIPFPDGRTPTPMSFIAQFDTGQSGQASLAYASYFGNYDQQLLGVAVAANGDVYATGSTQPESTFPATLRSCPPGRVAPFVVHFVPDGSGGLRVGYATCGVGGSLAVDAAGNAYLFGYAPPEAASLVTPNAFRRTTDSDAAAFLTKLDPSGNIVYASYLDIRFADFPGYARPSLAVDNAGHAYVTGHAETPLPVKNHPLRQVTDSPDAFVAGIDTNRSGGASLMFATALGGAGRDGGAGIALGPQGDLYVLGLTASADMFGPGASGAQKQNSERSGGYDLFVARLTPPPAVTSVAPATVSPCRATPVEIGGYAFGGASAVSVGGVDVDVAFERVDDNHLRFSAPPHAPGPVDVVVTAPAGTGSAVLTYDPVPVPSIGIVDPDHGSVGGGDQVGLVGSGFDCVGTVTFGGVAASSLVVASDGVVAMLTPPHARGSLDVVAIADRFGPPVSSAAARFTYQAIPRLSSVDPSCGPAGGGTHVELSGSLFSGATSVNFGTTGAAVTPDPFDPDHRLSTVAPPLPDGTYDVGVTGIDGPSNLVAGLTFTVPCPGGVPAPRAVPGEPTAVAAQSPTSGGGLAAPPAGGSGGGPGLSTLHAGAPGGLSTGSSAPSPGTAATPSPGAAPSPAPSPAAPSPGVPLATPSPGAQPSPAPVDRHAPQTGSEYAMVRNPPDDASPVHGAAMALAALIVCGLSTRVRRQAAPRHRPKYA